MPTQGTQRVIRHGYLTGDGVRGSGLQGNGLQGSGLQGSGLQSNRQFIETYQLGNEPDQMGATKPAGTKDIYDIVLEGGVNPSATYFENSTGKFYRWNGSALVQTTYPAEKAAPTASFRARRLNMPRKAPKGNPYAGTAFKRGGFSGLAGPVPDYAGGLFGTDDGSGVGSWLSKAFKSVTGGKLSELIPLSDPAKLINNIIGGTPQKPAAALAPPTPPPPAPPPAPAKAELPGWILPAGIGLAVLTLAKK